MSEDKSNEVPMVLRTLLRKDVHDKLTSFALNFKTGRDHWDYGVAIQVLLDFYEYHNKIATVQEVAMKLDYLLEQLPKEKPAKVESKGTELLDGSFVK